MKHHDQELVISVIFFLGLLIYSLPVPYMSAEDPESSGVEEQTWDEEEQVEVRVHLVHALLPAGHVVATLGG